MRYEERPWLARYTQGMPSDLTVDYATAKKSDAETYGKFFRGMLEQGIYLAPSQFEACFISLAHTKRDVAATIRAARESFRKA